MSSDDGEGREEANSSVTDQPTEEVRHNTVLSTCRVN
jgi:hypothetical protein